MLDTVKYYSWSAAVSFGGVLAGCAAVVMTTPAIIASKFTLSGIATSYVTGSSTTSMIKSAYVAGDKYGQNGADYVITGLGDELRFLYQSSKNKLENSFAGTLSTEARRAKYEEIKKKYAKPNP